MLSDLQKRDARTPHIGSDRVALTRDSLRCHIITRPDECIRISLRTELTTDSKITQLDLAISAEEDIAGFDVTVDDLLAVQVGQAIQDAFSDLTEHFFASSSAKFLDFAVDGVEGTAFAEFHRDADGCCGRLDESAVVPADMLASTVFVEAELADDLFLDVWVGVGCDDLVDG